MLEIKKNITTLQHLLEIEDKDLLNNLVQKLKTSEHQASLSYILNAIEHERYDDATLLIDDFLRQTQAVAKVYDPIVSALKMELNFIESELNLLRASRDDVIKTIDRFQGKYHTILSPLIEKLLLLRLEKLKIQAQQNPLMKKRLKEAQEEYDAYSKMMADATVGIMYHLNDKELREIKRLYRKACLICHPDRVEEAQQEKAREMFEELKEAYIVNDIKKVRLIAELLEKTGKFDLVFEKMNNAEALRLQIERVLLQKEEVEDETLELENSTVYNKIINIREDWKDYFKRIGDNFQAQIDDINHWLQLRAMQN